jgi:hypothetical protein
MAAGLFDSQMTQVNESGEAYEKSVEDSRQNIVISKVDLVTPGA